MAKKNAVATGAKMKSKSFRGHKKALSTWYTKGKANQYKLAAHQGINVKNLTPVKMSKADNRNSMYRNYMVSEV